jgi:hypothetical protein
MPSAFISIDDAENGRVERARRRKRDVRKVFPHPEGLRKYAAQLGVIIAERPRYKGAS